MGLGVTMSTVGRLLIVDDEPELMTALCDMLAERGFATDGCATAEEALTVLERDEFDLLLTDLMMPGMSGIELLRAASRIDPDLVGIVMTGQGTVQTAVEAMKLGAFDYILKPFKINVLLPTLSRALQVRRLRMENVQLRETVAIYGLSQAIAFTLDRETLLHKVADAALQQCEADEASILLPTPEGDALYVAAIRGEARSHLLGERVPLAQGIAGWVARQRQPLTLHGEAASPDWAPRRPRSEIRSAVVMPMLVGGKLAGVLSVNALTRRRPFTLGQVKALSILAATAASALENAQLHAQVRASEERFRALADSAPIGIFLADPGGKYLYTNRRWQKITGLDPTAALGEGWATAIHPEERDPILTEWSRSTDEGGRFSMEFRVRRPSGDIRWVHMRADPVQSSDGTPAGLVGTIDDFTARKRAEEALLESEERLRLLVSSVQEYAILMLDPGGHVASWNAGAERITGYGAGEILGQHFSVFHLPEDQVADTPAYQLAVAASAGQCESEGWRVRRDGSQYWASAVISAIRDEAGRLRGFSMVTRDLTERRRIQLEAEARRQQVEAVRAVAEEITRELDLAKLLALITRRAAELVGAFCGIVYLWDEAAQALVPRAWHGLGDWIAEVRFKLGEGIPGTVASTRKGLVVNDYRTSPLRHAQFLERTGITASIAEPLFYRDRFVGALTLNDEAIGRSFTEQDRELLALFAHQAAIALENARLFEQTKRHAEELEQRVQERTQELAQANQELKAASRHKSEFLANMSHELRTPLNSIMGFSQLLEEQIGGTLSEKHARFLSHIYNSGKHLLQLIGDILDLSKVEAGKLELHPEPLPVAQTLEDILVIGRGLAHKKAQTVETDIEANLPPLPADPVRFKQILFNLLSNAVKFTPEGGLITLRAYQEAAGSGQKAAGREQEAAEGPLLPAAGCRLPALAIEVQDTGAGIRAQDMPRLFQEFVQLEATASKHHEGSGLGLALTKRLVEMHGGRIWADSEGEGRGSTFTVVLPFAE
jgi:PAS domain S-box-containing protein